MKNSKKTVLFFVSLILLGINTPLLAGITITPTQNIGLLQNALFGNGLTGIDQDSISISFSGHSCTNCGFTFYPPLPVEISATSTGTFSNDNVYGMGSGLIMSTGGVSESVFDAGYPPIGSTSDGYPATPQQNVLLKPISGVDNHLDVTQITINFDMLPGFDRVAFNVVFASDDSIPSPIFPDGFPDGFGLFVNGTNIAHALGQPVSANHPGMKTTIGTRYESALNGGTGPLESIHSFSSIVNPTNNEVILIMGDALDGETQSAVFITASSALAPPSPAECDIQMSQASYTEGDTVTANVLRIANLGSEPIATEVKLWLSLPGETASVSNLGADGSFVLPAGTDVNYGPVALFPVTTNVPTGSYEFSCRFLNPVTGRLLMEDRNFFDVLGPL